MPCDVGSCGCICTKINTHMYLILNTMTWAFSPQTYSCLRSYGEIKGNSRHSTFAIDPCMFTFVERVKNEIRSNYLRRKKNIGKYILIGTEYLLQGKDQKLRLLKTNLTSRLRFGDIVWGIYACRHHLSNFPCHWTLSKTSWPTKMWVDHRVSI